MARSVAQSVPPILTFRTSFEISGVGGAGFPVEDGVVSFASRPTDGRVTNWASTTVTRKSTIGASSPSFAKRSQSPMTISTMPSANVVSASGVTARGPSA